MRLFRKAGSDLIIVRIDGGICSQIAFCSLGMSLRRCGYRVKYDLTFFRNNGKDSEGRFVRNWDMPKAFPALAFEEATDDEIAALKASAQRRSEVVRSWRPPLYVGGYPDCSRAVLEMLPTLREQFRPELPEGVRKRLDEIRESRTCAVHVRRGDLAHGNPVYGEPTSVAYYERAMKVVTGLCANVTFCFFSDEPAWARERLLPLVPSGSVGIVVEENGSDRGYLDLYLISQCAYVIASIGSLGVYGAMLSPQAPTLVLSRFSVLAMRGAANAVYLIEKGSEPDTFRADLLSRSIPEGKLHGPWYCVYRLWRKLGLLLSDGTVRIEMFPAR